MLNPFSRLGRHNLFYLLVILTCASAHDCKWQRHGKFATHEACAKAAHGLHASQYKCVMQAREK
jgi:hypothetical protein